MLFISSNLMGCDTVVAVDHVASMFKIYWQCDNKQHDIHNSAVVTGQFMLDRSVSGSHSID